MYGCGIGPVIRESHRKMAARVLNANVDAITLREPDSLEELRAMGVDKPEILLTADPALTLRQAPEDQTDSVLLRAGIPPHGRYICFALRRWKGFEEKAPLFSKAAEYAYRTYGLTPVFAAVEKHLDPGANQMAARGLSVPHYFLNDAGSAGTIIGALSRMEIVVSMRLHALIFAAGQGIPLAGVVYDPKVSAFLRYIGQEQFVDLEALTEAGLRQIENPSQAMLSGRPTNASGTCVTAVMEGTRPLLAEIQGLATTSGFGTPRRMSTGFDYARMALILAVLEKRAGFYFSNLDAYLNVVGGLRIDEPAVDLAVAMALVSSLKDTPIRDDTVVFGEIGLAGELRSVSHIESRVSEAYRLGFTRCVLPYHSMKSIDSKRFSGVELIGVHNVREAFDACVQ